MSWINSSKFFTRFSRWFRFSEDFCCRISINFASSSRFWNCRFWSFEVFREWLKRSKSKRLRLNWLNLFQRFWSWCNVKDLWKLIDLSFFFVIFDIRKNLSIALFRIKKSFWCLLRTWCDDDEINEINENWNDYLSKIDENSRVFRSKRFLSLEKLKMNFRKN
jgi:hypothetical protein